jgi:hypothetical protein
MPVQVVGDDANALHLRGVEGIQLPAALALLLRTDLIGGSERP